MMKGLDIWYETIKMISKFLINWYLLLTYDSSADSEDEPNLNDERKSDLFDTVTWYSH